MEKVRVQKEKLIKIIRFNRNRHEVAYKTAFENFKKEFKENLQKKLEEVDGYQIGQNIYACVNMQVPCTYLKDYDRILKMLQLSIDEVIELTEKEVQYYVLDEWNWKGSWATTIVSYQGYSGYSGVSGYSGNSGTYDIEGYSDFSLNEYIDEITKE